MLHNMRSVLCSFISTVNSLVLALWVNFSGNFAKDIRLPVVVKERILTTLKGGKVKYVEMSVG